MARGTTIEVVVRIRGRREMKVAKVEVANKEVAKVEVATTDVAKVEVAGVEYQCLVNFVLMVVYVEVVANEAVDDWYDSNINALLLNCAFISNIISFC